MDVGLGLVKLPIISDEMCDRYSLLGSLRPKTLHACITAGMNRMQAENPRLLEYLVATTKQQKCSGRVLYPSYLLYDALAATNYPPVVLLREAEGATPSNLPLVPPLLAQRLKTAGPEETAALTENGLALIRQSNPRLETMLRIVAGKAINQHNVGLEAVRHATRMYRILSIATDYAALFSKKTLA